MNSKPIHRRALLNLSQQHSRQLKTLLTLDLFLKGSVVSFKRKCGKKVCRCTKGHLHESLVVARWVKGKLRVIYTRPEDGPFLLAYRNRWRKFRKDKKNLVDLQKKILKQLDRFVESKTETYCLKQAKG